MRDEHREVLVECLRREQELRETKAPPKWQTWAYDEHVEQLKYGPHFSSAAWFQTDLPHEQRRYLRAVRDLERAGLVETWSRWGRRLTGLKLTAEGRRLALEAAGVAPGPAAG
jgi:hypothetical protein